MSNKLYDFMRENDRLRGLRGGDDFTVGPDRPSIRWTIGRPPPESRADANIRQPIQERVVSDPTFDARRADRGPPVPKALRIPR